jgi:hypothetical protein
MRLPGFTADNVFGRVSGHYSAVSAPALLVAMVYPAQAGGTVTVRRQPAPVGMIPGCQGWCSAEYIWGTRRCTLKSCSRECNVQGCSTTCMYTCPPLPQQPLEQLP